MSSNHSPARKRLPRSRKGITTKLTIKGPTDTDIYLTANDTEEGELGEIFLRVAKQGTTLSGMMDVFAIAISLGLQYGVPFEVYRDAFVGVRFEPRGDTDHPEIEKADSMADFVFQHLALTYKDGVVDG